mmetsp:Transcript_25128/g.17794  ORF Transcript_25128/g.17794 Transcript_25128/m.17794 type:complete len:141 (+) Transcript_25128:1888-2310(+)
MLMTYTVYESYQIRSIGFVDYLGDNWNRIDLSSIIMNVGVIISYTAGANVSMVRAFASIAVFIMWLKMFYWLRIFEPTASFIRMISEILSDSITFMVMLALCIIMFANPVEVLNENRDRYDEDDSLFSNSFGYPLNGIVN